MNKVIEVITWREKNYIYLRFISTVISLSEIWVICVIKTVMKQVTEKKEEKWRLNNNFDKNMTSILHQNNMRELHYKGVQKEREGR